MPRKFFLRLILFFLLLNSYFLILTSSVLALEEEPTPTSQPTCDLCGWCNPQTQPKPPDWDACNSCLYLPDGTPKEHTYYSVIGCLSTQSGLFVKSLLSIVFGIAGGVAFLAVVAGSITVLTSSGNPERIQGGKDMITSSIFGILLILFSVFLMRAVGFDILKIPGFG